MIPIWDFHLDGHLESQNFVYDSSAGFLPPNLLTHISKSYLFPSAQLQLVLDSFLLQSTFNSLLVYIQLTDFI